MPAYQAGIRGFDLRVALFRLTPYSPTGYPVSKGTPFASKLDVVRNDVAIRFADGSADPTYTKRATAIQSSPLASLEKEAITVGEDVARTEPRAQFLEDEFRHLRIAPSRTVIGYPVGL